MIKKEQIAFIQNRLKENKEEAVIKYFYSSFQESEEKIWSFSEISIEAYFGARQFLFTAKLNNNNGCVSNMSLHRFYKQSHNSLSINLTFSMVNMVL